MATSNILPQTAQLSQTKSYRRGKSYLRQTLVNLRREQAVNDPNNPLNWGWEYLNQHPQYDIAVYTQANCRLMFSPNGDKWLVQFNGVCAGWVGTVEALTGKLEEVKAEMVGEVA